MSLVAVATRFVLLAALLSCEPRHATPKRDNWAIKCVGSAQCESLPGYDRAHLGGADLVVTGCDEDFYFEVRFNASWRVPGRSRHIFEWAAVLHENDVFPLHGVVAEVLGCAMGKQPARPGPYAHILFGPATFAWAAPAPDHVFLPLEDEVMLDHDFRVTTRLHEPTEANPAPFVAVVVTEMGERMHNYGPLHEGDSFPWGDLRATIVRIIKRDDPIIGWVEVALSDPRGSASDAR